MSFSITDPPTPELNILMSLLNSQLMRRVLIKGLEDGSTIDDLSPEDQFTLGKHIHLVLATIGSIDPTDPQNKQAAQIVALFAELDAPQILLRELEMQYVLAKKIENIMTGSADISTVEASQLLAFIRPLMESWLDAQRTLIETSVTQRFEAAAEAIRTAFNEFHAGDNAEEVADTAVRQLKPIDPEIAKDLIPAEVLPGDKEIENLRVFIKGRLAEDRQKDRNISEIHNHLNGYMKKQVLLQLEQMFVQLKEQLTDCISSTQAAIDDLMKRETENAQVNEQIANIVSLLREFRKENGVNDYGMTPEAELNRVITAIVAQLYTLNPESVDEKLVGEDENWVKTIISVATAVVQDADRRADTTPLMISS